MIPAGSPARRRRCLHIAFNTAAARRLRFALAACLLLPLALAALDSGYPLSLADSGGYRLTLKQKPAAIVSLTLASDEILFDLVEPARLKAIDAYADDPGISNIAQAARGISLRLSGEKEKIIALQPDLVLLADWKEMAFVQALRDARVPVFVFRTPTDFAGLATLIRQLGLLCGEPQRAARLQAAVDRRLAAVAARVRTLPAGRRPTVLSYSFYGGTYAAGTSFDALASQAGVINAATRAGLKGWPQLSKEKLLELDPDYIFLPSWSYDGKADPQRFERDFLADPVFASLKAVRERHVRILPDRHLAANSQYMADGVEDIARAVWPELFP
jgi:iron complex transport system substrate-binding protein